MPAFERKTAADDTTQDATLEPARGELDATNALEALRRSAQFDEFVAATRQAADAQPDNAAVLCLLIEAQLAGGETEAAAQTALIAAQRALDTQRQPLAFRALRMWIVARMRLGLPLGDSAADRLVAQLPANHSGAAMVRYWIAAFHDQPPFALEASQSPGPYELASTQAADGTIWADLNAVEVTTNGVLQPMVFIDTGAQSTVMSVRAAESAGVTLGAGATELVGFAGVEARPAVLDSLDLGGLTLHNVPVLVGNAPALMSANGQMALGAELMHHVRFTLDYPSRKVTAEKAGAPPEPSGQDREVRLWTFSQGTLSKTATDHGPARAMIDTGNRFGTYLSARWARHHLPQFERPGSHLVFKIRHRGLTLTRMNLGDLTLVDWPVGDRIPRHLEQLDLVDVLVGRDLLWPYRLSIDLRNRVMRLADGPESPTPPPEATP
jgi:hypothetical protein